MDHECEEQRHASSSSSSMVQQQQQVLNASATSSPLASPGRRRRFIMSSASPSPIGTPIRKALASMRNYLEEIGHIARLKPQDAWLPITESRSGNAYYSCFHSVNAGIGFQALLLPVAMTYLGWTWGTMALVLAFAWQMYTLWILIKLHEATPGQRYNRYQELAQAAFGDKWGSWLTNFPIISLSAGTAGGLTIIGGSALRLFYNSVCNGGCHGSGSLTPLEWYLVFAVLCAIVAQLPNLNSIATVSLLGAVMAVAYTTMVWALSVAQPRPAGISYHHASPASVLPTLNALGIIAFAFRGHNLALEIQATMPSSLKHPSYQPMWSGSKVAYLLVALCYFPIAMGGYWAYGSQMLPAGILVSMFTFHHSSISPVWLATCFLFVVLSSLSSFQIYSMPTFDVMEQAYTSRKDRPCPRMYRIAMRLAFVFLGLLVGVAFPFLASIGGLLGGLCSVPVTFGYPCFMWLAIARPQKRTFAWYINWTLGLLALVLTLAFTAAGIWSILDNGLKLSFFKPM